MTTTASYPVGTPAPRRRSRTRLMVVLASAVVVLGGGAYVVGLLATSTRTVTTEIAATVSTVALSNETGDVQIVVDDGGTVRIARAETSSVRTAHSTVEQEAGTVRITGDCSGFGWGSCRVDMVVRIPRTVAVQVDVDTGDVRLDGIAARSTVRSDTGDVTVTDPTADVSLTTGTGDVTVTGARGGVTAAADTGDVTVGMAAVGGELRAAADTGDVQITLPADGGPYAVDASTDTGSRVVEVPEGAAGLPVTAIADTGDVVVRAS